MLAELITVDYVARVYAENFPEKSINRTSVRVGYPSDVAMRVPGGSIRSFQDFTVDFNVTYANPDGYDWVGKKWWRHRLQTQRCVITGDCGGVR